ncbi:MAG: amidohydrolase family protein [Gammaproteobacteria bacterium]|nr:amidohydrolase family protein [Gammaproteobacteria bacterium]
MTGEVTYTNVRLWDGIASEYSEHSSVTVRDGIIQNIGVNRGEVRDYSGLTCIPGLIDAHVHMTVDPAIPGIEEQLKQSKSEIRSKMRDRAKSMVLAGITTARDLGGGDWLELELRDQINKNEVIGPRLLCAGRPITSPKGHCYFWHGECSSVSAASKLIDKNIRKGVDLIKIMATGGVYTKGTDISKSQFSQPDLSSFVNYANSKGLDVAAHCHGTQGICFAAYAGVNTIEHCSWRNADFSKGPADLGAVQHMARENVYVSPTIHSGWEKFKGKDNKNLEQTREIIREMKGLGAVFIASTDAGIPNVYHNDLPKALPVFAEYADFLPREVLKSATSVSAKALKMSHRTGSIRPGLAADLVFVEGDPLEDLRALKNVKLVVATGQEFLGEN